MQTATIRTIIDQQPPSGPILCVVPQDKSLLHRILFIASISQSVVTIPLNSAVPDDVQTTINALRDLGVRIEIARGSLTIHGVGLSGLRSPKAPINCQNSGTTARFLMGLLAGQKCDATLLGDESLSKRPMQRLASILNGEMGAQIECSDNGTLPVSIKGKPLKSAVVTLPVASAQMKSSLLLAGLTSGEGVTIQEPAESRDHTERMLRIFGCNIECEHNRVMLRANASLITDGALTYRIPGDPSSAAFMVVAAAILRENITIENVGLNPTRTAFLDVLSASGVPIFYSEVAQIEGERVGKVTVSGASISVLKAFSIGADLIPNLQDEIPALAAFACFATGMSTIRGAAELRKKESDRLAAIATNLTRFGVSVRERTDGLEIDGRQELVAKGCTIDHAGDHRIAMAMAVAALRAPSEVTIPDASVVSISFPAFFESMRGIAAAAGKTITIV